jgi:hypothetical protein
MMQLAFISFLNTEFNTKKRYKPSAASSFIQMAEALYKELL